MNAKGKNNTIRLHASIAAPRFAHLMSFRLAKFVLYYIGA